MSELDYKVKYVIDVEASKGVEAIGNFAKAVHGLTASKTTVDTAVKNVRELITGVDAIFKGKTEPPRNTPTRLRSIRGQPKIN